MSGAAAFERLCLALTRASGFLQAARAFRETGSEDACELAIDRMHGALLDALAAWQDLAADAGALAQLTDAAGRGLN